MRGNMLVKIWNYLSNNGVKPEHTFNEATRIRVLNRLCIVAVLLSVFYIPSLIFIHAPLLTIVIELAAATAGFITYLLVKKHMATAGALLIFIYIPFGIMLMNLAVGKSGAEYFYLAAFILSFYFFRNQFYILFLGIYYFILFIFAKDFEQNIDIPPQLLFIQPGMYYTNIFLTFVIGFVFHRLFVLEHDRNRKEIENKNILLKQSAETAIQKSNEIKILLKELSHRTKNNLQLVSSLINIQASKLNDENAKKALLDGKNRIISIALLHKKLYQNENITTVSFKGYIDDLVLHLIDIFDDRSNPAEIIKDIENFDMKIDDAVTLGLIINELLTNSFNHGLSKTENKKRFIKIIIRKLPEDLLEIIITDSGHGIEYISKEKNLASFGFGLVKSLVKQMDGSIYFAENNENSARIVLSKL